jgi:hypothetical protein
MSTWGQRLPPNWRAVRQEALKRDKYICVYQFPGICTNTATEVNHRVGIASRGLTRDITCDDVDMLDSCCRPCHDVITEKQRLGSFQQMQAVRRQRKKLPKAPHPGTMTSEVRS